VDECMKVGRIFVNWKAW